MLKPTYLQLFHPTASTFRRLLRLSRSAALGSKAAAASPSLLSRRSAAWPLQRLTYAMDTGGDRGLQGEATRKNHWKMLM